MIAAMDNGLSTLFGAHEARHLKPRLLRLAFGHACAARVRHLLEDEAVVRCLDTLAAFLDGSESEAALESAAIEAAALANRHPGSRSLDGVGHAAVSASYAVANALAGRAVQAADYAAYAAVYGHGGYGAVNDPESFVAERTWQRVTLEKLADASARSDRIA